MNRIYTSLAALALVLLAACQSEAPTAPSDSQAPTALAQFDGDSISSEVSRGGTMIGSGH